MTHAYAKKSNPVHRSVRSEDRVETNGQTDGRTRPIALTNAVVRGVRHCAGVDLVCERATSTEEREQNAVVAAQPNRQRRRRQVY